MRRVLILAATRQAAADYAAGALLPAWRYCEGLGDLVGASDGSRRLRVMVLPGAADHPQYATLHEALEMRRALFLAPESP